MTTVLGKILFTTACLLLPVLWGVFINWIFRFWQQHTNGEPKEDPIFPDYQI